MSGETGNIVEHAVNAAFAEVEKHAPEEFKEVLQADTQQKEIFRRAVKETAEEEVKLAAEFNVQDDTLDLEEIAKRLKKHYSDDRL